MKKKGQHRKSKKKERGISKAESKALILKSSWIENVIHYTPLLISIFTASEAFAHIQTSNLINIICFLFSLHYGAANFRNPLIKFRAIIMLAVSTLFFAALQIALKNQYAFYILATLFISHLLLFSSEVVTVRGLLLRCTLRIVAMSSLALLGAITQSQVMIWGILILGYIPGCFLAAADLVKYSDILSSCGWNRISKISKQGKEIIRPGSLTRLLSLLLVVAPGLVLLFLPFGFVPSAVLLIAVLFYPALSIVEAFQEGTQDERTLYDRTINAAILSAVLMPMISVLSIGIL